MTKRRIVFLSAVGLALVLLVLWPTINALRVRHSLAVALQHAKSVRLEEFAFHVPLASVELPRGQWPQVLAAMPVVPDAGVPGSVRMCFIPHHRVVVTDPQDQSFAFTVCFACDQAHTERMGIFATPYLWCGPLRRLFTGHAIRIRTDREYTDTLAERTPRT